MFYNTGPASPYSIGRRTLTAKAVDPTLLRYLPDALMGTLGFRKHHAYTWLQHDEEAEHRSLKAFTLHESHLAPSCGFLLFG